MVVSSCYSIVDIENISKLLQEDSKSLSDFEFQMTESNLALVYHLSNGQIVMMPAEMSGSCILYNNQECFDIDRANDSYPDVRNNPKLVFERYSNELMHLQENNIDTFLNILYSLDISPSISGIELLKMAKSKMTDVENAFYFSFYVVLADLIRRENSAKWILVKKYRDFQSYYEPQLLVEDLGYSTRNLLMKVRHAIEEPNFKIESFFDGKVRLFFPSNLIEIDDSGFIYQ